MAGLAEVDPLARLTGVADVLVDPTVGIIHSLREVRVESGGPAFFHYAARAADTGAFVRQRNFRNSGGAAVTRGTAMAKSIGEAVERYCSAIYEVDEMPLASFAAADFEAVGPGEFALYSDAQYDRPGFPWTRFEADTPVRWTPATDLADGRTVHVPAARVFMPYTYYLGTGEAPIDQPISTGMACHCSLAEATLGGICEVVERDAVMIAWQAMLAPPQIRVETLSDANYDLVQRFDRAGCRVTMLDLSIDHGIPVILSCALGRTAGSPALVVAGSASPDPEEAARKSLEELAHTHRYSHFVNAELDRMVPDPPDYESVADQMTHLNFYVDEANLQLADFLLASKQRRDFDEIASIASGDPAEDVRRCVERIRGVGERVLVSELTTPDVGELGLHVVRAIVPGFQPLHMGYPLRALGGRRLWEVPAALGYAGVTKAGGDNPAPHPYP